MNKEVVIPATLQAVSNFTAGLDALLVELPMEVRVKVVLAVQELCVNIVEHAYDGVEGDIVMQIHWNPTQLELEVVDRAPKEFQPPAEVTAPDPFSLPEGGMGLFILHHSFDEVTYSREQDRNIWKLQKTL
ncbi:MAG: ATP-binding protein [Anaerolineae bacterium]|nr:ATP-binding protein [Anaerolineae bacterium]